MSNELLETHRVFHETALKTVLAKLTSYGNEISCDHELAPSGLCELAALTLDNQLRRRVRFALRNGQDHRRTRHPEDHARAWAALFALSWRPRRWRSFAS